LEDKRVGGGALTMAAATLALISVFSLDFIVLDIDIITLTGRIYNINDFIALPNLYRTSRGMVLAMPVLYNLIFFIIFLISSIRVIPYAIKVMRKKKEPSKASKRFIKTGATYIVNAVMYILIIYIVMGIITSIFIGSNGNSSSSYWVDFWQSLQLGIGFYMILIAGVLAIIGGKVAGDGDDDDFSADDYYTDIHVDLR